MIELKQNTTYKMNGRYYVINKHDLLNMFGNEDGYYLSECDKDE